MRVSLSLALICGATCAAAELAIDDVLKSQKAVYAALGLDENHVPSTGKTQRTITDQVFFWDFGPNLGRVTLLWPDRTYIQESPESVLIVYGDEPTVQIELSTADGTVQPWFFFFDIDDLVIRATGTRDALTYTSHFGPVEVPAASAGFDPAEGSVRIGSGVMTTTVKLGEFIEIYSVGELQDYELILDFMQLPLGERGDSGHSEQTTVALDVVIPRPGFQPRDPARAFRDGLNISLDIEQTGLSLRTGGREDYGLFTLLREISSLSRSSTLNSDGLNVAVEMGGPASISVLHPFLRDGLRGTVEKNAYEIHLPFFASPDHQTVRIAGELMGLTFEEDAWNSLDPQQILTRGPFSAKLDAFATVTLQEDLLDIDRLLQAQETGAYPVNVHALTVLKLEVDAFGSSLSTAGELFHTPTDPATWFDPSGLSGSADLTVTRALGLLEELRTMTLLSALEQLAIANFIASYGDPVPPDGHTATVTLEPGLRFTVNGQNIP